MVGEDARFRDYQTEDSKQQSKRERERKRETEREREWNHFSGAS